MVTAFAGFCAVLGILSLPAVADVRQLFVSNTNVNPNAGADSSRIYRVPLVGKDAYQLIEFAGPGDGLDMPVALAIDPVSGRLYAADGGTGEILVFEINGDGTRAGMRVFGKFPFYVFSMDVRPSTGRVYIGVAEQQWQNNGIYRMTYDGSSYEKVVEDYPKNGGPHPPYFTDQCWVRFNPADDVMIYVGTGLYDYIRKFRLKENASGYVDIGVVESYDRVRYEHPHPFFIHEGGGIYSLIANTQLGSSQAPRALVKFQPGRDEDIYVGELPIGGPTLTCSNTVQDFVQDEESGKLYAGTVAYSRIYEIANDYSNCDVLFKYPDFPTGDSYSISFVEMSYGHSDGGDPSQGDYYNYVELHVRKNASGNYSFSPGEQIVLEWEVHDVLYALTDVPVGVYLAAAKSPPGEDRAVTTNQIMESGALYIFNSSMQAVPSESGSISFTFPRVSFPAPGLGSSGTLAFRAPSGMAGNWVFAAAFVKLSDGSFPYVRPVELSNGFSLR
jgi:hypothetical protein